MNGYLERYPSSDGTSSSSACFAFLASLCDIQRWVRSFQATKLGLRFAARQIFNSKYVINPALPNSFDLALTTATNTQCNFDVEIEVWVASARTPGPACMTLCMGWKTEAGGGVELRVANRPQSRMRLCSSTSQVSPRSQRHLEGLGERSELCAAVEIPETVTCVSAHGQWSETIGQEVRPREHRTPVMIMRLLRTRRVIFVDGKREHVWAVEDPSMSARCRKQSITM